MPAADQGLVGAQASSTPCSTRLGSDRRRGIDAHPAAPFDPHLVPGMRIALPHYPIICESIESSALIAGHDTRRYARRAHQHGERRGIVFAEPAFGIEQKLIHGIVRELGRRQRVVERLLSEHGENGAHVVHVVRVSAAQSLCELQGARIAIRPEAWYRDSQHVAQAAPDSHSRIGSGRHIHRARHRIALHQGVVAGERSRAPVPRCAGQSSANIQLCWCGSRLKV